MTNGTQCSCSHYLEEKLRSEEDVDEAEPDEGRETRAEHPRQVEILPVWGHQGGAREAGEDCGGDEESRWHNAGVHHDGHLEEGSHTETSQKSKAQQHGHSSSSVLAVVRSHKETNSQASSEERVENPPATEEIRAQVDVGPGRGGQHRHGEAGIDVLQVGPDVGLTGNIKINIDINQTTREQTMRVLFCVKTHNFVLKELKKLSIVAISSYLQTKSSFNNFINEPSSKNQDTSNALLEL